MIIKTTTKQIKKVAEENASKMKSLLKGRCGFSDVLTSNDGLIHDSYHGIKFAVRF